MLENKKILLIISGGIAAYKSLELIRGLRKHKAEVNCILTENASKIVTPLVVASLSEGKVHQEMFSLVNGSRIGHVQLSRDVDLIVAAPATANLIAKMALGIADNLASTTLLAANKPVMIAPAMNTQMWKHHATQKNMRTLEEQGIICTGPKKGGLACGEVGEGRMSEPEDILKAIIKHFTSSESLSGKKALVTSGATQEPIDAVRFISNYSSGKQGHAIAKALAEKGADVTLISGVVSLPDPTGVKTVHVKTADEMMTACNQEKGVDIAVCAAAVADWKIVNPSKSKMKKTDDLTPPKLEMTPNIDILASICKQDDRPKLVIGFAAETDDVIKNAAAKRKKKGCDCIVANDVSSNTKVFGGDNNKVHLITENKTESWEKMTKHDVAEKLCAYIAEALTNEKKI